MHETDTDTGAVTRLPHAAPPHKLWTDLSAPIPSVLIKWRQDGKVTQRDGRFIARFVAYIEANTVRQRLDEHAPGAWSLLVTPLPNAADEDGVVLFAFRARLTIHGVTREDVGTGHDYKSASTDAFKRVAVRFGIGHELYDYEQNWVEMDGDGRYARPVEDPARAYARKMARLKDKRVEEAKRAEQRMDMANKARRQAGMPDYADDDDNRETGGPPDEGPQPLTRPSVGDDYGEAEAPEPARRQARSTRSRVQGSSSGSSTGSDEPADDVPLCPNCGGTMWDNRLTKRNPKAPDFKCRDRNCTGVVWPPRPGDGMGPEDELPF